ncbi:S1 family peptidase [Streptomyces sp. NPDC086082]|uniref:S1 family peptidase n=1 Tax=Streptomyces sp. NPDC086082 TaxID=3365750 RepID=UPI0038248A74
MAELDSAKAKLDHLAGIPNTSWGVDQSSNRVEVEVYDGVSAADRARIANAVSGYGDAVAITERSGKIESSAYDMRGGVGITSQYTVQGTTYYVTCSAGFNVQDDVGTGPKYMLTAGHCMGGGATTWHRRSGDIPLGSAIDWAYGNDTNQSDYGLVEYTNSNVTPYGTIQYKDGSEGQISRSAAAYEGEPAKRVGTMSQDLVGTVLKTDQTTTYTEGTTLKHMIETDLCDVGGDSGGALFSGETALGITSGGNYLDQPCGDSDSQADRRTWFEPVDLVLSWQGLKVY